LTLHNLADPVVEEVAGVALEVVIEEASEEVSEEEEAMEASEGAEVVDSEEEEEEEAPPTALKVPIKDTLLSSKAQDRCSEIIKAIYIYVLE